MANSTRDPRPYEMMAILLPDLPEEETQAAVERIKGYIADATATVSEVLTESPWGRRRLAYEMRFAGVDYRDGYYVLMYFTAAPNTLPDIERELKLDTQVIRYLLVSDDPKVGEKPGLQGEGGEAAAEDAAPATAAPEAPAAPATDAPAAAVESEAVAAAAPDAATESDAPVKPAAAEAPAAPVDAAVADVTDTPVEDTAAAIEGEEAPAPADAPAEAPAARRSNKLPAEGEGADWVAGDGTDAMPDGFPIKGNATSKIYHPQESPNYSNTIAEIYFATGEAAERHGYRLPKTLQNAGAAAGAGLVRNDDATSEEE